MRMLSMKSKIDLMITIKAVESHFTIIHTHIDLLKINKRTYRQKTMDVFLAKLTIRS